MSNSIYTIYKHTNKITNKSYIGQTKIGMINRWKKHLSELQYSNTKCYFHNSIRKHGSKVWDHEILFTTYNKNIVADCEIFFISYYDTHNNGYNLTIGGEGVNCNKNALKGKYHPLYGKSRSLETKRKISLACTGNNVGKSNYQNKGCFITPFGKSYSVKTLSNNLISVRSIQRWCKTPERIVTPLIISKSKYFQSLSNSPLGKTFKELGFDFII